MRKIFLMISFLLGLYQLMIAQNVGIGTTSPVNKLDIQDDNSLISSIRSNLSTAHFKASSIQGAEAGINFSTYSTGLTFNRWVIAKGDGGETGSNDGSNFIINRYDDAGAYLGRPLEIVRATGEVFINNKLTTPNFQLLTGATSGYILQSDASGNASWVSPSSSVVVAGTGLSYSGNTLNSVWTVSGNNIYKNNSGNVGIGTSSPSELLQVGSSNSADNYIKIESGGVSSNYSGIKFNEPGFDFGWTLRQNAATDDLTLDKQDGTFTNVVTFKRSGNVGIGVSAPVAQLHLSNNLTIDEGANNTGDLLNGALRFGGSSGEGIASNRSIAGNENGLDFYTGYDRRMSITNDGNIGIGTEFPNSRFHINLGSNKLLKLESTATDGTWLEMQNTSAGGTTFSIISTGSANGEGAGKLLINTPGKQLVIDNTGNLGIGTTSPGSVLHIKYGSANSLSQTPVFILDNPSGGTQTSLQFRLNNVETGRIRSDLSNNMIFSVVGSGDHTFRKDADLTDLMIIKGNTGNTGIGTSSPSGLLHLKYRLANTDVNTPALILDNPTTGTQTSLQFRIDGSEIGRIRADVVNGMYYSITNGDHVFRKNETDDLMIIKGSSGNVGIGTNSPATRLHVSGASNTLVHIESSSPTGSWVSVYNGSSGGTTWDLISTGSGNSEGAGNLLFRGNGSVKMMVQSSTGNVGIGTTSPSALLHVNNNSGTASVTIQSTTNSAVLNMNAGASGMETSIASYTSGSQRWSFGKSNGAESGSNAGSDFFINRYNDAGAFQGQPFIIKRSNGNVGIGGIGSPVQKLDVAGNINVSSTNGYYINNSRVVSINGTNNLLVGVSAGQSITTGSSNTAIGHNALEDLADGINNVAIGDGAGASITDGNGGVFIGHNAGQNETQGAKLYIENSSSNAPLIYGDFGTDSVAVNGSLIVEGNFGMKVRTGLTAGGTQPNKTAGIWIYTTGTGSIDLTIPAQTDRTLIIINQTGGTRTISSYQNLSNAATTTVANNTSLWLVHDGTTWRQIK